MYDYAYKTSVGGFYTFKLVTFIIAIAATIIIYTVFMDKRNKDTYSNPLKKLFPVLLYGIWAPPLPSYQEQIALSRFAVALRVP